MDRVNGQRRFGDGKLELAGQKSARGAGGRAVEDQGRRLHLNVYAGGFGRDHVRASLSLGRGSPTGTPPFLLGAEVKNVHGCGQVFLFADRGVYCCESVSMGFVVFPERMM